MEKIFERLEIWRKERGIDKSQGFEFDLDRQVSYLTEEITEYLRANNDYERIDALCDLIVFSINGNALVYGDCKNITPNIINVSCYIYEIIELLCILFKEQKNSINLIYDAIITACMTMIYNLGFDFNKCMDETLKEIESRKGAFNDKSGKWEKFKDEDSVKLWYNADYESCKK